MTIRARPAVRAPTWLTVVALSLGFLGAACGGDGSQRNLPPGPPVVVVTMREYRFDHPASIAAGRVVFRIPNAGREPHRLALAPIATGLDGALEQLRVGQRLAATAAVPNQLPGMTGAFAVDLTPGRYGLFCLVSDSAGNHALRGMASELEVR